MEISVVIPCYNSAATIKETVKSVLVQTRPAKEIIVVDDGSSDEYRRVLKKYEDRILVVRQENSGVSVARNTGVARATGEWIAFCDSDDVWDEHKLEICAQSLEAYPSLTFLFHNFYVFNDDGTLLDRGSDAGSKFFPIFRENKTSIALILGDHSKMTFDLGTNGSTTGTICVGNALSGLILGNFILPSTVVIRRNVFLWIGGFDPTFPVAEDTEFFLRASKNIDFLYVDLPLVGYRHSRDGLTGNISRLIVQGMRAFEKNCLNDPEIVRLFRRSIGLGTSRRLSRMSYYHLSECQRSAAAKYALGALRWNVFERQAWFCMLLSLLPSVVLQKIRKAKARWKRRTFS